MKKLLTLVLGTAAFVASAYTIHAITTWKIDNTKTQVKFTMQAHGQELIGSFKGVNGDVKFDAADLAGSSFKCSVAVSTINTGDPTRDGHLQGAQWFDATPNPALTFTSNAIVKTDSGYKANGTLTVKGITKDASIPFTFTGDKATGTFKGSFTMKRSDYNIGKAGGDMGDDVKIDLEVPVTAQ